jgi:hypothetical protein
MPSISFKDKVSEIVAKYAEETNLSVVGEEEITKAVNMVYASHIEYQRVGDAKIRKVVEGTSFVKVFPLVTYLHSKSNPCPGQNRCIHTSLT